MDAHPLALPTLTHPFPERSCLIRGVWIATDNAIEISDPATDHVLTRAADAGTSETEHAVEAAHEALQNWSIRPAPERAALVRELARRLLECTDELALLMTLEQGKPLAEARGEIVYAASFLTDAADRSSTLAGRTIPHTRDSHRILTYKRPVGVCALITPWNFPSAMLTRKLGPALVAGNTVVAKPAELTPLSALAIGAIAEDIGFPPGVINLVTGAPEAIGRVLTTDPRVRKLSFTGSTRVGLMLGEACARDCKHVSLELGGNAPFVVLADADIERAARGAIAAKLRNAGQTCISANRFLVHERVYDAFAARVRELLAEQVVGPGTRAGVTIGPLIGDAAVAKVERHLADAADRGAEITLGGGRVRLDGFADRFIPPTVVEGLTREMLTWREEVFGPVFALARTASDEEALELANDSSHGLAAYVYSQDPGTLLRFAESLEAGIIGANDALPSAAQAPFGGVKHSGLGREGGDEVFDAYTQSAYVSLGV